MTVVVVGRNSLLAQAVARQSQTSDWLFLDHVEALEKPLPPDTSCVINFAFDPAGLQTAYQPNHDFDRILAERVAGKCSRFIMCSSRKVYSGTAAFGATETTPCSGADTYGINKAITERALTDLLGDAATILRIGNVVGFDGNWHRPVFMSQLLSSLKHRGKIIYDVGPSTRRDFITDDAVARAMIEIVRRDLQGIYNLGSGVALPIGQLAAWVMEGYGDGKLVITSPDVKDEFVLNVSRLQSILGPLCSVEEIQSKCLELGRDIADA
tara:strand:- start:2204 stop:3007 length:804 start_codon:yes stop_codon:yes gene_type:complete